jgi:hypothetical protein
MMGFSGGLGLGANDDAHGSSRRSALLCRQQNHNVEARFGVVVSHSLPYFPTLQSIIHQPLSHREQSGSLQGTSDISKFSGFFTISAIEFFFMHHGDTMMPVLVRFDMISW